MPILSLPSTFNREHCTERLRPIQTRRVLKVITLDPMFLAPMGDVFQPESALTFVRVSGANLALIGHFRPAVSQPTSTSGDFDAPEKVSHDAASTTATSPRLASLTGVVSRCASGIKLGHRRLLGNVSVSKRCKSRHVSMLNTSRNEATDTHSSTKLEDWGCCWKKRRTHGRLLWFCWFVPPETAAR